MYPGKITDVPGILVGNATDENAMTGVTVVYPVNGAVAGVDVRGGGPATRETDALSAGRLVDKIHAVMLSGGSAFGLRAADGIMAYLEEHGVGYDTGFARVPIIPGASLYDLGFGRSDVRPTPEMGRAAIACASKDFEQGPVGAGTGATVGKLLPGGKFMRSGLGSASLTLPGGSVIGAIVAVNAAGDVFDAETGEWLAGETDGSGNPIYIEKNMLRYGTMHDFSGNIEAMNVNTTLMVIATDAKLTREKCGRLAAMAHDGYARSIRPVHLPVDGDTVFALCVGEKEENELVLMSAASVVAARAIANAATAAKTACR